MLNIFRKNQFIFLKAIENVDVALVDKILRDGTDPNLRNKYGLTPLHLACSVGGLLTCLNWNAYNPDAFLRITSLLLENGADPNAIQSVEVPGSLGFTPLHCALTSLPETKFEIIQMLVDYGANVNAITKDGQTPLEFAIRNHLEPMIDFLRSKGAQETDRIKEILEEQRKARAYYESIDPHLDLRLSRAQCKEIDNEGVIFEILRPIHLSLDKFGSISEIYLTPGQRILLTTFDCESEICNGGFCMYFYSSCGNNALEAIEDFRLLGADKKAALLKNAIQFFPDPYPSECDKRIEIIKNLTGSIWERLDSEYYDGNLELIDLQMAYIEKNPHDYFID